MNIGIALKRVRSALAISQGDLSELTSLSVSMISAIEKGVRVPSGESVEHLLTVLGLSREELEVICSESDSDFDEKYRKLAELTRAGILEAIAAQHHARKQLRVLA